MALTVELGSSGLTSASQLAQELLISSDVSLVAVHNAGPIAANALGGSLRLGAGRTLSFSSSSERSVGAATSSSCAAASACAAVSTVALQNCISSLLMPR